MAKSAKRRFLSLLNLFICFALFCCLAACGSGGSRSVDGTIIASFTGSPTSLSAGQSSILTVKVTDSNDQPVSNETVSFEFTNNNSGATLTTFDGGNTDADGYALAIYRAGSTNPDADVEDSVQASTSGSTKAVIITREKPSGLNLTLASNLTNNQMSSGGNVSLTATVLDDSGNPVNGMTVTFDVVTNNSGATTNTGTAITDAIGKAIWIYTAGSTAGVNDSITATVSGGGYESTDTIIMQID